MIDQKRIEAEKEEAAAAKEYLGSCNLKKKIDGAVSAICSELPGMLRKYLTETKLDKVAVEIACNPYSRNQYKKYVNRTEPVDETNIEAFVEYLLYGEDQLHEEPVLENETFLSGFYNRKYLSHVVIDKILKRDRTLRDLADRRFLTYSVTDEMSDLIFGMVEYRIIDSVSRRVTEEFVWKCLDENPFTHEAVQKYREELARMEIVRSDILKSIPERYIDLYPVARSLHRRFVLHVGPTNSGKTYEAMEALKASGSGIYLGPLRLLAFEQYENLNLAGYTCNLVTGEEETIQEGATFQASTIEMLQTNRRYKCAVIDEAQMLSDEERGGAWTAAILGVAADEVHICMAPEAEWIVEKMIGDCEDTFTVVHHERKTPLVCEKEEFVYPTGIRKGDALIVFSKKNVHAVASELRKNDYRCSVIYGALPYDVRHEEAKRFALGETDVVVATDAIGMGMNLPIKRIVFLQAEKFDGKDMRLLSAAEVKQIAGRAGRYGIYDTGLWNSDVEKRTLSYLMRKRVPKIEKAVISFPESLISIEGKLSSIMEQWNGIEMAQEYDKADISREIALCALLEKETEDKKLIYDFISIPFDEKEDLLKELWLFMFECRKDGIPFVYEDNMTIPEESAATEKDMEDLELSYKICDLLFNYKRRFARDEFEWVLPKKNQISAIISAILAKQSFSPKRCRVCGRALSFKHKSGICDRCYFTRADRYA